ncbi:hypothetical protein H6770_03345 [Candidatus Peribacteria bacterium]|nr:hypothetical protein [Candidatus Peribacteria bacterium]
MPEKGQLLAFKKRLLQLGEFDVGPVAEITFRLSQILNPQMESKLNEFLGSEEIYKPDATRRKLIELIDTSLASELN